MADWVCLAENFFNVRSFPLHVVSAEEEPAGFEAFRVASARRSGLSYATATTANSDWWVKVVADRVRAADMIVLDRGHNLAGKTVRVEVSQDNFATWETIFNAALPTAPAVGSLDGALGVMTEEGAWVLRFPKRIGTSWRVFIPAMGAGLKPIQTGVWLGPSFGTTALTRPLARNRHTLVGEMAESALGWQAFAKRTPRREGVFSLRFPTLAEGELARLHLEGHYGRGRPTWIVPNSDDATDAFLSVLPVTDFGIVRQLQWYYGEVAVPYQEFEPLEVI